MHADQLDTCRRPSNSSHSINMELSMYKQAICPKICIHSVECTIYNNYIQRLVRMWMHVVSVQESNCIRACQSTEELLNFMDEFPIRQSTWLERSIILNPTTKNIKLALFTRMKNTTSHNLALQYIQLYTIQLYDGKLEKNNYIFLYYLDLGRNI